MNEPRFYYPELDGLRLIAFLLVFIHHAPVVNSRVWEFAHSFGWIGVDLFFALSAFLFVRILAKEYEQTGSISVRKFYIRRGLRIWPIYALYCLLMLAWSVRSVSLRSLLRRAIGLFTFTDNIVTAFRGYNPIAYTSHLWTISYEEQFYLIIPVMLVVFFRWSRSRVVTSLAVTAVTLFAFRALLIGLRIPHPTIWVLPVTHFESILLGLVAGLGVFNAILDRISVLVILGVGVMSAGLMVRMGPLDTISWKLMVSYPLIGIFTSSIVYGVFRTGKAPAMRWLSFRPCVYLGKISYGLYVYHIVGLNLGQELVRSSHVHFMFTDMETGTIVITSLALTIVMASGSYLLIEKPFLRFKKGYEVIASRPV